MEAQRHIESQPLVDQTSEAELSDLAAHSQLRDLTPETDSLPRWDPDTNVLIAGAIPLHRLRTFDINPVADPRVRGLGFVRLHSVRTTADRRSPHSERSHRLYSVELGAYRHVVEITDPAEGEAQFTIASLPGFSESIEGPIRQSMQEQVAIQHPQARVVSIGSNGIGITGGKYTWKERSEHGLAEMAAQRLAVIKLLAGDMPVIGDGTSMGSVVMAHLAHQNSYSNVPNGTINLVGQRYLSVAAVDPARVIGDMGLRFPARMAIDVAAELAFKTSPKSALQIGRQALRYGLQAADLLAMGHQVTELLQGTPEQFMGEVVSAVQTVIISGETDPLAQQAMWDRIDARNPGQLARFIVKNRGHCLPMKPARAAAKMTGISGHIIEKARQESLTTRPRLQTV